MIPCNNAAATLPELLQSLGRQSFDGEWEVVAVDDGSTDETREVLERYQSRLPLVIVDAPRGKSNAARARNLGVAAARGEVVLFCDADDVMDDAWGRAMQRALCTHGFVQARVERRLLNASPWLQSRRSEEGSEPPFRYWGSAPHSYSAVLGVRRALHDAIGGMDESYDTVEDVDYCWRLQQESGEELAYVPEAVVHMRYRTSWMGLFNQARSWGVGVVRLYAGHRAGGFGAPPPRRQWSAGVQAWLRAFGRLRFVHNAGDFADWLFRFGYLVGWAQGSARYRTLLLYPYDDERDMVRQLVGGAARGSLWLAVSVCDAIAGNSAWLRARFVRLPLLVPHPRVRAFLQRNFADPLAAKRSLRLVRVTDVDADVNENEDLVGANVSRLNPGTGPGGLDGFDDDDLPEAAGNA